MDQVTRIGLTVVALGFTLPLASAAQEATLNGRVVHKRPRAAFREPKYD